jgi:DinB family protein
MCWAALQSKSTEGELKMPAPLVQAMIGHVESVFVGPNGDYPAVLEALMGVSVVQARWKPRPEQNSIWQIVDHLTASKQWQIDMLEKGQASSPVWTQPAGDEAAWQAALAQLKDVHARLMSVLKEVSEDDLLKDPMPEWDRTLLELVLSSGPAHEAHHSGQIDYLKGLQAGG